MIGSRVILVLGVAMLVAAGPSALAQEEDVASLGQRMDRLSRSLEQIAASLEAIRAGQKIDVLIRRIQLAERRLSPLDGELQSARYELRDQRQSIDHMENLQQTMRDEIDRRVRDGADPTKLPEREELRRMAAIIEVDRERLVTLERSVLDLEDRVGRGRDRIEILDEQLQELLEE